MIINSKAKAMNFELKKLIQSNVSNITSTIAKIRNISSSMSLPMSTLMTVSIAKFTFLLVKAQFLFETVGTLL